MNLPRILILTGLIAFANSISGQTLGHSNSNTAPLYIQCDSNLYAVILYRANCKGYFFSKAAVSPQSNAITILAKRVQPVMEPVVIHRPKLITIHGNISYDFFYRSAIDTPVAQRDFRQHTERIYLDVMIKEKYPLKVNFSSRQSNSPFFRNFLDVNLQFDRSAYTKNLKQLLLNKLKAQVPKYQLPDLKKAENELKKQLDEYTKVKSRLEDGAGALQKMIEEKERNYYSDPVRIPDSVKASITAKAVKQIRNPSDSISKFKDSVSSIYGKATGVKNRFADSLSAIRSNLIGRKDSVVANIRSRADSIIRPYAELYENKKKQLDSLKEKVDQYKSKVDSIKTALQKNTNKIRQRIYNATDEKELRKIATENGIELDKQSKLDKQLAAVKSFSIGRSQLNYTELTAQNITITGLNVEYNPSYYVAFSAGKIDYRFRDFLNRNTRTNNQYIVMGRLGIGNKEHGALIFSYFTGRKNTVQFSLSDSVKNYVNIMGYSVEALYQKDKNTSISAEFAKSTKPVAGNLQGTKQTSVLWKYSDKTNMGINIKAQTVIAETNTRLSGFFRKTGENFQSFSLFSYNTDQTAWLARADQPFFKNKVTVTGMLRRNDFTNPFTDKTYKTSTVFKSILLNIRFPKYPTVSLGYYPGTQLYLVDKQKVRESAYYMLNGSVVYNYLYKGLSMNSSFIYNRYTNEATDSGFIAYKGVNYYASQTVLLKKLQLQVGYAYSKLPELKYYTLESSADYVVKNWLSVGVGGKYNQLSGGNHYWGERAQLSIGLKQFGTVQFQYEKSYLPTINQTLYPVEIGRVSYYKNF